jgi:hypothetical protein
LGLRVGDWCALLRSVCVIESQRGKSITERLVACALLEAIHLDLRGCVPFLVRARVDTSSGRVGVLCLWRRLLLGFHRLRRTSLWKDQLVCRGARVRTERKSVSTAKETDCQITAGKASAVLPSAGARSVWVSEAEQFNLKANTTGRPRCPGRKLPRRIAARNPS